MKSQKQAVALVFVLATLFVSSAFAVVPSAINYQGHLSDDLGNPIIVPVDLTFKIYTSESGGSPLWAETHIDVPLDAGFFAAQLGSITPFPSDLWDGQPKWLGISVESGSELVPRSEVVTIPYALLTSGVSGDIETNPAEILITGRQSISPKMLIKDDPGVTPSVNEHLTLNDLSLAVVVDRGAGNKDSTTVKADGLRIYDPTGVESIKFTPGSVVFNGTPVDFSGTEAQWLGPSYQSIVKVNPDKIELKSLDAAPIPVLPGPGEPFIALSDDVINQLFASLCTAGKLRSECWSTTPSLALLSSCEMNDHSLTIRANGDTETRCRIDDDGLTLVVDPSGTSAVYTRTGVQITGPTARRFAANPNSISLKRPSNNDAVRITLDDPTALFACDVDDDGLTDFAMASVPSKRFYLASGCQLRCDGTASFSSSLDCGGMVTLGSTCEIDGATQCHSSLDVEGTMSCKSGWECDVDNDLTPDVSIATAPSRRMVFGNGFTVAASSDVAGTNMIHSFAWDFNDDAVIDMRMDGPTVTLSLSPATSLDCGGNALFSRPVQINSNLTVNGALLVTGPKAFVQDNPEDPTKEIVYVALEGDEAGTYTRGSSQLKNGVAKIELPEDFHLVTNEQGLTVQITPRGPVNSMLYVESVTPTLLVVKASNKKDADVKFDFMVNGLRRGFENHQVIQDKKDLAMNN